LVDEGVVVLTQIIAGEEKLLVKFFGSEYVEYRARTRVGIPGIS
jgi:protein-S-isoprenylcysteine O-methyltransferase Ste14